MTTPDDFQRVALALEGAEQGSHMGAVDFRVGGRIFATLASVDQGFGNLIPGRVTRATTRFDDLVADRRRTPLASISFRPPLMFPIVSGLTLATGPSSSGPSSSGSVSATLSRTRLAIRW